MRICRKSIAGKEDIDGCFQLDRDVVFELGITPPWGVIGEITRFAAESVAGDVDHGVARRDPIAEHIDYLAIVGREIILLNGVIIVVFEPLLHEIAHRAKLAGDCADEDPNVAADSAF